MKLGIISDLHIDHQMYYFDEEPDVHYINAGDIAHTHVLREYFHSLHPNIMTIPGNHDYYGRTGLPWLGSENDLKTWNIGSLKIKGATLWTHMQDINMFNFYAHSLNDARYIFDMTPETYQKVHEEHKAFLFDGDADVIVMHHAPSFLSIHPKYAGDSANIFFANKLDKMIENMAKPPLLIIHGHVHSPFDYYIGKTRVVCHPRGYPGENYNYDTYQPKILEL